tara:strand:+ start:688 stop:876 length:189 start_codon:yes stop_codon:yes gene_type:complete
MSVTPLRPGMVVRRASWATGDTLTITAIGRGQFLGVDVGGFEDAWFIDQPWVVMSEPLEECF